MPRATERGSPEVGVEGAGASAGGLSASASFTIASSRFHASMYRCFSASEYSGQATRSAAQARGMVAMRCCWSGGRVEKLWATPSASLDLSSADGGQETPATWPAAKQSSSENASTLWRVSGGLP